MKLGPTTKSSLAELKTNRTNIQWLTTMLSGSIPFSYERNLGRADGFADYEFPGTLVAKIISFKSETFHKEIADRILNSLQVSKKQAAAVAHHFAEMELTLGDITAAMADRWGTEFLSE